MENDEMIKDMSSRFANIMNSLKSIGKTYPNGDLVNKVLRSLTSIGSQKSPPFKKQRIWKHFFLITCLVLLLLMRS